MGMCCSKTGLCCVHVYMLALQVRSCSETQTHPSLGCRQASWSPSKPYEKTCSLCHDWRFGRPL